MHQELQNKLDQIRKERSFNPKTWIQDKCNMLNEYMRRSNLKACVVNVSGGIDSAVTVMLAKKSMEMKDSPIKRVIGITQPIHSTPAIMQRAEEFLKERNIESVCVDQTAVFDLLSKTVEESIKMPNATFASGQLKSYMRTPVAYYVAQLLSSNGLPAIVLGTGNYDEDGYLYYFCKPGDGTSDVQLIHDLHKSEVFSVAKEIGVTEKIISAPPSADLWEGQTDENELGFSYDFVELYVSLVMSKSIDKFAKSLSPEAKKIWDEAADKIEKTHRRNRHKESWPINLDIICPNGIQYKFD